MHVGPTPHRATQGANTACTEKTALALESPHVLHLSAQVLSYGEDVVCQNAGAALNWATSSFSHLCRLCPGGACARRLHANMQEYWLCHVLWWHSDANGAVDAAHVDLLQPQMEAQLDESLTL